MSAGSAWSVALIGTEGTMVEVEVAIGAGLPRTILVGLPDTALYEARDRCRAAFSGAGLQWPQRLVTINLTPASLPKSGTHYDLAIMAAVLAAAGAVPGELTSRCVLMGEVGLDARVRAVRGVLPALLAARTAGFGHAVVPAAQEREARLVEGITVWGVTNLDDLVEVLHGRPVLGRPDPAPVEVPARRPEPDLADVVGHASAKWALEVAAAGRHHVFMHGPPGVGKTMLAERLPTLLPDLTDAESLEVSALHSLAGDDLNGGLVRRPPYSDPHHSASVAALVGGGSRIARPGAISLAHRGILFLDEGPEFSAKALDALRTPLESGWVSLARAETTVRYPARFQLVVAANPCPCGMHGVRDAGCSCTPHSIRRYQDRLSGPMRDRIDIHLQVSAPRRANLGLAGATGESSAAVRDRVTQARERQQRRLGHLGWTTNGEVPGPVLRHSLPAPDGLDLLEDAVLKQTLSPRGVDKVWRLAWTLSDLAGHDRVTRGDLRGALMLRRGEECEAVA